MGFMTINRQSHVPEGTTKNLLYKLTYSYYIHRTSPSTKFPFAISIAIDSVSWKMTVISCPAHQCIPVISSKFSSPYDSETVVSCLFPYTWWQQSSLGVTFNDNCWHPIWFMGRTECLVHSFLGVSLFRELRRQIFTNIVYILI